MSTILLQELFGARFFIPKQWRIFPEQERWNYHPALPPGDVETSDGGVDCVICLERIEFPKEKDAFEPVDEEEKERLLDRFRKEAMVDVARLSRWNYMVSSGGFS